MRKKTKHHKKVVTLPGAEVPASPDKPELKNVSSAYDVPLKAWSYTFPA